MVKMIKKGSAGEAGTYLSRNQAIRKLQVSLKDFRRLCILKGVYPHEPNNPRKVGKGSSQIKTYYLAKDIRFLLHEPVLKSFRELKVFFRKLKKAFGRQDEERVKSIRDHRPVYTIDHIVRERYPSFIDAVRDLDDCLSMCFLFATLPKSCSRSNPKLINNCRRLSVEFMNYVIMAKALRKVFISIKGIYYQIELFGQTITWIVPHARGHEPPSDVDFRIMQTFVEFYTTLLSFVNYRLYTEKNLFYPPKLEATVTGDDSEETENNNEDEFEHVASLTAALQTLAAEPEHPLPESFEGVEVAEEKTDIFAGMKFFLNREVPREALVFVIRSFGGMVSWDKTVALGATFSEDDENISHQIVDRPSVTNQRLDRLYIQPQWVFDCINNGRVLPAQKYFMGEVLPPHLSPFVTDTSYVPSDLVSLKHRAPMEDEIEEEEKTVEDKDSPKIFKTKRKMKDLAEHENETDSKKSMKKKRPTQENIGEKEPATEIGDTKTETKGKRKMAVKRGMPQKPVPKDTIEKEETKLRSLMMPKKHKRLHDRIMHSKKKQSQQERRLLERRAEIEKEHEMLKAKKQRIQA